MQFPGTRRKPQYPCIECGREVSQKSYALQCDDCSQWQHLKCISKAGKLRILSGEQYRRAVQEGRDIEWRCEKCDPDKQKEEVAVERHAVPEVGRRARPSRKRQPPARFRQSEVFAYINATWVASNARWPPSCWSAYCQSIRTNNDVEGWHHALNNKAPQGNLTLYKIVPLLYNEAQFVKVQIQLVSEGKLSRYQRKKYGELNGRLDRLWTQLKEGKKKPLEVLECAAHLYGNMPNTDTTQ